MALLIAGCSSENDEAEIIPEPVPQDTTKNETTEMPETPQPRGMQPNIVWQNYSLKQTVGRL